MAGSWLQDLPPRYPPSNPCLVMRADGWKELSPPIAETATASDAPPAVASLRGPPDFFLDPGLLPAPPLCLGSNFLCPRGSSHKRGCCGEPGLREGFKHRSFPGFLNWGGTQLPASLVSWSAAPSHRPVHRAKASFLGCGWRPRAGSGGSGDVGGCGWHPRVLGQSAVPATSPRPQRRE